MTESLFEKLLCKVLPHRDIWKVKDGVRHLYLRRFLLWKRDPNEPVELGGDAGGLFLHVIHRSDDDRDPHDHPWPFTSVILWGHYHDLSWFRHGNGGRTRWSALQTVGRAHGKWNWIVHRAATHLHHVLVPKDKPVWTLVLTGPREREWGFVTPTRWVHWREYLGLEAPSHGNPPPGYGPCTRDEGHDGPCAHPLAHETR